MTRKNLSFRSCVSIWAASGSYTKIWNKLVLVPSGSYKLPLGIPTLIDFLKNVPAIKKLIFVKKKYIKIVHRLRISPWNFNVLCRQESSNPTSTETSQSEKLGGFAKAFAKQSVLDQPEEKNDIPFATLLRTSKFIDLGDPQGKIVTGTIFHVVDDDLYIDFGWKFHCVCVRPQKVQNSSAYVRGAKVRLKIKDLELSTKFLGSDKDLTLLEADAQLLGLVSSPVNF